VYKREVLGLAISKKLCQLMGGDIGVESRVDIGSTFSFNIVAAKSQEQPARLLQSEQSRLDGKRLLIIAGNAEIRRSISRDSRNWGMNPYIAGSGSEALYWIRKSDAFDVAIVDQAILEDEGQSFVEEIKSAHRKQLPLIGIYTNDAVPDQDNSSYAAHLSYSFSSSQLNNVLAGVFSSSSSATVSKDPPPADSANMAAQHPLHILLAEDNRVNQKVATRLLEKLGYEIDVAENGRIAIEALEKQPYDVVLMDIQMPEMDGVEATKAIRSQWPADEQPRIIALTAHALEGDREHYLAQGMDDYISKPIQIDKLIESLYKCVPIKTAAPNAVMNAKFNQLFDASELQALMGDDAQKFLETLLPIYVEEAESSLSNIQEALEKEDPIQLKNAIHSLKGNSANIALSQIVSMCQKIEMLDFSDSQSEISSLIEQISHSIDEIKQL
jgi:CheY-like chemotaxis protein